MKRLRRLIGADEPQETRVFLINAAFGTMVAVIYWFVSYEVAGTLLLLGFGLATGVLAFRLAIDPMSGVVRDRAATTEGAPDTRLERDDLGGRGGTADIDRPFVDERGRLPGDSLAPFAVGLGAAIAATGPIFGVAPVIVGLLPFLWGAWTWLSGARAELDATTDRDVRSGRMDP